MAESTTSSSSGSTAASTILTTLGAGSGIDIFKMSRDLTDVEKLPKQEKINDKIEASTAQVSAYGLVKYQLEVLKLSFEGLNDANEMATNTSSSTNATAVSFTSMDGTAQVGSYDVSVSSLANGQQSKSIEYTSGTQALNGGTAFNITLGVGTTGGTQVNTTIAVAADTPQGIVNAINGGDYGVTATLVDTGTAGTAKRIILSGSSGTANAFTIATAAIAGDNDGVPDLGFTGAEQAAVYKMPFVNADASGATSDQNLTFSFGGKTATIDLFDEGSANAARYTARSDTNLLAAINAQLDAQGIGFTASDNTSDGFTFTQDTAGVVASSPTMTVDGGAVSVTRTTEGKDSNTMQSASDAVINFNGLTITRASNTINDVVTGAVLSINQITETSTGANPARVSISSDTSTLKGKVQALVTEYNNFNGLMSELGSSATDDENDMMGALRRDTATVRYIQNALRTSVLSDSSTKVTGSIEGLRDIGVSMDKSGNLTFDEKSYDSAITANYDNVVTMLTADTTNQSEYSTAAAGLSQDIAKVLDNLGDTDSVLSTRNTTAETAIETYEEELADLEKRMEAVYDRYLSQFSAMEGMMNSMNGTKDYLEGQLESLSKAYDS
ncbi:MAG: flagellar filament capping protein FliD [Porticoccaceae bacterium]|nr:flagellar filament capping protein FliD [Porticoccaceae bacterium]